MHKTQITWHGRLADLILCCLIRVDWLDLRLLLAQKSCENAFQLITGHVHMYRLVLGMRPSTIFVSVPPLEDILPFSFSPPISNEVNVKKKGFAPRGAYSFLYQLIASPRKANRKSVTKSCFPLLKQWEYGVVSNPFLWMAVV